MGKQNQGQTQELVLGGGLSSRWCLKIPMEPIDVS